MKRDYRVYLRDLLQALRNTQKFVGEAAKQIPASVRKKYPQIPWSDMAGMRDKLIHFYFGVDMEIVWETVKVRVPAVEPLIKDVLSDLEQE
jgi:uncharacterized protein with HEPN domain